MKKIKGLLLAATLMLSAGSLMGQTYTELGLKFSQTRPSGSARILGMGGAQVSLGGDFSSASSNPAGLGMYNRSEFSITPGYMSLSNNGDLFSNGDRLSSNNKDTRTSFSVPGLALIFSTPQSGDGGFVQGSFAVTMTKINDFNSNLRYEGLNPNTSIIDYAAYWANGHTTDYFNGGGGYNSVEGLAYRNFLIDAESEFGGQYDDVYISPVGNIPYQSETAQTKGGQTQWNLSYGANFNDKFFLGAGLGIVALNFQSHKVYSETFDDGPLYDLRLIEDLTIKGTGINFTVGGIFRPVDGLQIGAAIATPTRYNLTDTYTASMRTNWDNFDYYEDGSLILKDEGSETDVLVSTYNFTSPWKFSAGASYIFGKSGLISLDVEHLNYANAKYNSQSQDVDFRGDNDNIKATYVSTTNIRVGGEYRINSFRVRGGFNYTPDAMKQAHNDVKATRMAASAGLGYRSSDFFIDFAYINSWGDNSYTPYTIPGVPVPNFNYSQKSNYAVATIGFLF